MEKITTQEFSKRFDVERINRLLQLFSMLHFKDLPEVLLDSEGELCIMIDAIPVADSDIILPVAIRSTAWLRTINRLSGTLYEHCQQSDFWPIQNRFDLIGGIYDLCHGDMETILFNYVKRPKCKIFNSDRLSNNIKTEALRTRLKDMEKITLSEEFKKQELFL